MLSCEILTSEAGIEAIADEWRRLYDRAEHGPFSDYDLFAAWWRTVGKGNGRALHVVIGRDSGRLAAILPLVVIRRGFLRVMQAAGHQAYNYCGMLAENADQALDLWRAARQSRHYDFADIRDVYPDTLSYRALSSFARRRDEIDAYFLHLGWSSSEEWIASLSGKTNRDPQRRLRRLGEKGTVRFEVCTEGQPARDVIDGMVEQKVAWARKLRKPGLFGHPDVHEYFRQTLELAAGQKRLFLAWLKCGDNVIAYNQGFINQGVIHGCVVASDPAWSAYSPGILVLRNSICWAIDNGLRGIDLRQGTTPFKLRYANETRRCSEFTFSGSLRGRLLEGAFCSARALMRSMKNKTGGRLSNENSGAADDA